METARLPVKKATLEDVQEQFETWRKTRRKRKRIPARLWKAAACLSEDYPLSQISSVLRVNYTDLRHHVMAHQPARSSPPECSFVEVDVDRNPRASHYTIELEDCHGSRMKVCCSGGSEVNPVEFIKVFWSK